MDDCIFCKIIRGEIPSYKVYEDDQVYAFLDISQTTPGHTLLVPKKHVKDIFAYDADLAQAVFSRLPKLARAIRDSNPAITGMNILNNNGAVAYQSVFHSHIHLVPRYSKKDDFSIHFGNHADQYDQARYEAVQKAIVNQVNQGGLTMFNAQRAHLKALVAAGHEVFQTVQTLVTRRQTLKTARAQLVPVRAALIQELNHWQRQTAPHRKKAHQLLNQLRR